MSRAVQRYNCSYIIVSSSRGLSILIMSDGLLAIVVISIEIVSGIEIDHQVKELLSMILLLI